jgi:DNA-directed RNA polymerase subunit alpha
LLAKFGTANSTFFAKTGSPAIEKLVYFAVELEVARVAAHAKSGQDEHLRPVPGTVDASTVDASQGREPEMSRIPLNRAYEQSETMKDKLEMSTAEIGLAVRTTNCLEERGVFTVNDLLHCTREDLLSISNFGEKTLEEVYKALERVGFYRPGKKPEAAGTAAN